jgi:hypothetical protein
VRNACMPKVKCVRDLRDAPRVAAVVVQETFAELDPYGPGDPSAGSPAPQDIEQGKITRVELEAGTL